jgi:hypothetical protein
MWNIKRYATIAAVGTGLVVAAATSASACGWGFGGYPSFGAVGYGGYGGCGGYGFAGYGGCGGYGLAGYGGGWGGWGWPSYGFAGYGGCGGYGLGGYGLAGYGGWGGGWGGWGSWPAYGFASGWGCHAHHRVHGYGGYAMAYMPRHYRSGYAYAAYSPRHNRLAYAGSRHHRQLYASAHGLRYSSNHPMKHHLLASL